MRAIRLFNPNEKAIEKHSVNIIHQMKRISKGQMQKYKNCIVRLEKIPKNELKVLTREEKSESIEVKRLKTELRMAEMRIQDLKEELEILMIGKTCSICDAYVT